MPAGSLSDEITQTTCKRTVLLSATLVPAVTVLSVRNVRSLSTTGKKRLTHGLSPPKVLVRESVGLHAPTVSAAIQPQCELPFGLCFKCRDNFICPANKLCNLLLCPHTQPLSSAHAARLTPDRCGLPIRTSFSTKFRSKSLKDLTLDTQCSIP